MVMVFIITILPTGTRRPTIGPICDNLQFLKALWNSVDCLRWSYGRIDQTAVARQYTSSTPPGYSWRGRNTPASTRIGWRYCPCRKSRPLKISKLLWLSIAKQDENIAFVAWAYFARVHQEFENLPGKCFQSFVKRWQLSYMCTLNRPAHQPVYHRTTSSCPIRAHSPALWTGVSVSPWFVHRCLSMMSPAGSNIMKSRLRSAPFKTCNGNHNTSFWIWILV